MNNSLTDPVNFIFKNLSVGGILQNLIFYALIIFLFCLNRYVIKKTSRINGSFSTDIADGKENERAGILPTAQAGHLLAENKKLNAENETLKSELNSLGAELEQSYIRAEKLDDQLTEIANCFEISIAYNEAPWKWFIDIHSNELILTDYGLQVCGLPKGTKITWIEWLVVVDNAYRKEVETALNISLSTGADFSMIFQINPIDGSKSKWIRSFGATAYDDSGKAVKIAGTFSFIFGDPISNKA